MKLDVGCGWNYKGDVNIDLYVNDTVHRLPKGKLEGIPNLIVADGHKLPFRNDVFELVYCHHLLEHEGIQPLRLIRELVRVSKDKVEITVPSVLCITAYDFPHDKIFTPQAFNLIFRRFKRKVNYCRFSWKFARVPVPWLRGYLELLSTHFPIPCPIPSEIVCEVGVKNNL